MWSNTIVTMSTAHATPEADEEYGYTAPPFVFSSPPAALPRGSEQRLSRRHPRLHDNENHENSGLDSNRP